MEILHMCMSIKFNLYVRTSSVRITRCFATIFIDDENDARLDFANSCWQLRPTPVRGFPISLFPLMFRFYV